MFIITQRDPHRKGLMINRDIELGYGTVTKTAMQDRALTLQAKGIYAYICSFAGGKDEAWPSLSKMCYDLGVSRQTLQKHIRLLVDNEYIEKAQYYYKETGQFSSTHYTILK